MANILATSDLNFSNVSLEWLIETWFYALPAMIDNDRVLPFYFNI